MEKVYCAKCNGVAVKNGFQSAVQRYKCKLCQKKFR
ncbi:IS1/IS1595 family N-terminal zinc-binding domain-containing protein [Flavobacterium lindanitolerans]